MTDDDLHEPSTVQESATLIMHLLDRCNLRCQHCYMDSTARGQSSLPIEVVVRTLDDAERLGIRTVYLSGGEPFLYPDLSKVLSYASGARPFYLAVCTNGTLIGRAEANQLKISGVAAQVSIDGDQAYHDSFRGSVGAFHAATTGIQELVTSGVPVTVVVTISRSNLSCLSWLADWAADLGVECLNVQPLQQLGRGRNIAQEKLSEEQICALFMQVSDLGYAYGTRGLRFRLAYRARTYLLQHPCAAYVCNGEKCHRGITKEIKTLIVREDGTVLPEIATLNPRFALGSVHETRLDELVKRYFGNGYDDFHEFCRAVYYDVIRDYASPIVPWNEILSERSWTYPGPSTRPPKSSFTIIPQGDGPDGKRLHSGEIQGG